MNDGSQATRKIIILGALSTIGEATARLYASEGAEIVLVARNEARLGQVAADLTARGSAAVHVVEMDLAEVAEPTDAFQNMLHLVGGRADVVMLFYGALGDQRAAETDVSELRRILKVNFTSAAQWCSVAAAQLERQKSGVLLAVSSVAGDRGRQSNYVYGAAKAGLTVLMQGIAHRLAPSGARAVAVKLGFVDTAMTDHLPKSGPLWAKPENVARQLKTIIDKSPHRPVRFVPWFWAPIMATVRSVPSALFHKTKL